MKDTFDKVVMDETRQEEIRKASLNLAIKDTGKRITEAVKSALGNIQ